MPLNRTLEYTFFFGLLGIVAFFVWRLVAPFATALALAAIIVTICYPLYLRVKKLVPKGNASVASFLTTILVVVIIFIPLLTLGSFILREAISLYTLFNNGAELSFDDTLRDIEQVVQIYIPTFSIDIASYFQQAASFIASHIIAIFAGTASTLLMFFITLIAAFYFFRDGKKFTKYLIEISPLPDTEDELILSRLARSVRSVALGTVLVALIQGILTAIGLSIFGFERAILWGSVAAIGALVPGIGTSIVFVPAIAYLTLMGAYLPAVGVAVWAALAVGLIDNFLGPYLISRGGTLHPFAILLSVLGGIVFFGPIGFVLGPVILSLFKVLLELYVQHLAPANETEQ